MANNQKTDSGELSPAIHVTDNRGEKKAVGWQKPIYIALIILGVIVSIGCVKNPQKNRHAANDLHQSSTLSGGESNSVSPDLITKLEIGNFCQKSFPCKHCVTIVLSDGLEKTASLDGVSIYALVKAINDKHKIIGFSPDHFNIYEKSTLNEAPSPESVLLSIFGDKP